MYADPKNDYDGLRFVKLNKEDVVALIRERCELMSEGYKRQTQLWGANYNDLDEKGKELWADDALNEFNTEKKAWSYAAKRVGLIDGKVEIPLEILWSTEYEIVWLCNLINNVNWDCADVMLCGY